MENQVPGHVQHLGRQDVEPREWAANGQITSMSSEQKGLQDAQIMNE